MPGHGNGQATGMTATEDVMHMLEGMGIETGVNLDKLIECVWMCEEILGRHLWGHICQTGPRPTSVQARYDVNAPFVETLQQATHCKRGPEGYAGAIYPCKEPITSPYRGRVERGLPPFEVDGDWPWNEVFFPKPSSLYQ